MWRSGRKLMANLAAPQGSETNVNRFSKSNMASILRSLRNGDIRHLQQELEAREMEVTDIINGRSQLHYAADHGQVDMLRYLVENGANVNVTDEYGVTPLLTAIWEGHTDCVHYLLAQGACKNGLTPDGKTYLEVADKEEIRKLLQGEELPTDSSELEQLTAESHASLRDSVSSRN